MAVPGEIVLTGPYVDQWGGGHVITLSKAIVQTLVYGSMSFNAFLHVHVYYVYHVSVCNKKIYCYNAMHQTTLLSILKLPVEY